MTITLTQRISPFSVAIIFLTSFFSPFALCQSPAKVNPTPARELEFHVETRITADGDEYNALLLSQDERQLFIASEKGDVIVWDIAGKRILKRLSLGKPVHAMASVPRSPFIFAAGSYHLGNSDSPIIRRWNTADGRSKDFTGFDSGTFVTELVISEDGRSVAETTRALRTRLNSG